MNMNRHEKTAFSLFRHMKFLRPTSLGYALICCSHGGAQIAASHAALGSRGLIGTTNIWFNKSTAKEEPLAASGSLYASIRKCCGNNLAVLHHNTIWTDITTQRLRALQTGKRSKGEYSNVSNTMR